VAGFGVTDTTAGVAPTPVDTTRLTAEPGLTDDPATGLSLITLPEATVLLDCGVTVPRTKPAPVIAVVAAACVSPTTFGTDTCAGPLETIRFTAEPVLTDVPATGLSLITLPEATVLLDCGVTVPRTKLAPVIAVVAAACVSPTTFGTDTCPGPLETTRFTAEPVLTDVPATGLSLITLPEATVLLGCGVTVPRTKPAPVIAVVASACVSPTTLGTVEPTVSPRAVLLSRVPLEPMTLNG